MEQLEILNKILKFINCDIQFKIAQDRICPKHKWGDGPWQNEPDFEVWLDKDTNYFCLARRNTLGAWCGYVILDKDHPCYNIEGLDGFSKIDVHWGVTLNEVCWGLNEVCWGLKEDDIKLDIKLV